MIREVQYSPFIEEKPIDRVLIDGQGREVLSSKPVSLPIDIPVAPSSMSQLVHELYMRMKSENIEVETFADADDFDVPDELGIEMTSTPYEQDFDHVVRSSEPSSSGDPVPEKSSGTSEVND